MESYQLLRGPVPSGLRPDWISLGVPVHKDAVVVGAGDLSLYGKGRLSVRLEGLPVHRAEIWRQDDRTVLGGSGQLLQVEIIKKDETPPEWPIFARPLGSLSLRRVEGDIWLAEAEDMEVLEQGGPDWFIGILMQHITKEQTHPDFERPASAQPEL